MKLSDYLIDLLLILVVFRQLRRRLITPRTLIIPIILVLLAVLSYKSLLRNVPAQGNNWTFIALCAVVGATLGLSSGYFTKIWIESDKVFAQASIASAALWVVGMGSRFGFSIFTNSRHGQDDLFRWSRSLHITTANTWAFALILMAILEVISRVGWIFVKQQSLLRQKP